MERIFILFNLNSLYKYDYIKNSKEDIEFIDLAKDKKYYFHFNENFTGNDFIIFYLHAYIGKIKVNLFEGKYFNLNSKNENVLNNFYSDNPHTFYVILNIKKEKEINFLLPLNIKKDLFYYNFEKIKIINIIVKDITKKEYYIFKRNIIKIITIYHFIINLLRYKTVNKDFYITYLINFFNFIKIDIEKKEYIGYYYYKILKRIFYFILKINKFILCIFKDNIFYRYLINSIFYRIIVLFRYDFGVDTYKMFLQKMLLNIENDQYILYKYIKNEEILIKIIKDIEININNIVNYIKNENKRIQIKLFNYIIIILTIISIIISNLIIH